MRKFNFPPLLMIILIITSLTLTSCVKEIKNSIDNEDLQNENLSAAQKKNEITMVADSSLIIYSPKQEIKLDSKIDISGKEEKIKEAYNKPGKLIKFDEKYHIDYSANRLWTTYSRSKKITMLRYDKQQQQFIFQKDKSLVEEKTDFLPILIFLALLGISIFSLYTKFHLEIFLPLCLCSAVFILSINYFARSYNSISELAFICGILAAIMTFGLYGLMVGIFKLIGLKDLPMKQRHARKSNMVLAYCFAAAAIFIAIFHLPSKHLYIPNFIFLSPYLIYWGIKVFKTFRSWILGKIIRRSE